MLALLCLPTASSLLVHGARGTLPTHAHTQRCMQSNIRADYGDNFYIGTDGPLPEGVFEVAIEKPLGIQFEEKGPVIGKSGVKVIGLVDGGNAKKCGKVEAGDELVGVTAIQYVGSKWERKMFDCSKWGFDTVVDAIASNEPKFDCVDVILQFSRPAE